VKPPESKSDSVRKMALASMLGVEFGNGIRRGHRRAIRLTSLKAAQLEKRTGARHLTEAQKQARSIPAVKFRIRDLMQIASRVMEQVNWHKPDAIFVDTTGIGWHDRLNQPRGRRFRGQADRTDASDAAARYANKRTEMWGFMKEWCKAGCLPDDNELTADLPSCWSATTTCASAGWPHQITATRWRSPSPTGRQATVLYVILRECRAGWSPR